MGILGDILGAVAGPIVGDIFGGGSSSGSSSGSSGPQLLPQSNATVLKDVKTAATSKFIDPSKTSVAKAAVYGADSDKGITPQDDPWANTRDWAINLGMAPDHANQITKENMPF